MVRTVTRRRAPRRVGVHRGELMTAVGPADADEREGGQDDAEELREQGAQTDRDDDRRRQPGQRHERVLGNGHAGRRLVRNSRH